MARNRATQVIAVGLGQMVAWASSTYLPAMLAAPMARDHDLSPTWVFAAFSCALGIMAMLGPAVGRIIDRQGGRRVLCRSNLILAAGLFVLGISPSTAILFLGWSLLGVGMALGLYDAAFAALVRQHGLAARAPITGITLLGGFASTLGWPLTAFLVAHWDWRIACFSWAGANLLIALPLNYFFIPALPDSGNADSTKTIAGSASPANVNIGERQRSFILLAIFGAATAFVTSAMAAHLPTFLAAAGVGTAAAIGAAALVGPTQVLARLGEFIAARRYRLDSLSSARFATALHPLAGLVFLVAAGPAMALVFAGLHGAGNGLITIAKGTLTLSLFGPQGYGVLQGKLAVAQRVMQALAPFLFALLMAWGGAPAGLGLTVTMSLVALLALALIRKEAH